MEQLKPIIFIPSATYKTKPDSKVSMVFATDTYIKKNHSIWRNSFSGTIFY